MDTPPTPNPHQWTQENQRLGIKLLHNFDNLSEDEKHDIVQDFWLTGKDQKFEGKSKFSTYYCRVLINKAIDHIRKRDELRIPEEKRTGEVIPFDQEDHPALQIEQPTAECTQERFEFLGTMSLLDMPRFQEYLNQEGSLQPYWRATFHNMGLHLLHCEECMVWFEAYKKDPDKVLSEGSKILWDASEAFMATVDEAIKAKQEYEQKKDSAIKELLENRKKIDQQLVELGHGETATRKKGQRTCSNCLKPGHNAKTCPEPKKKTTSK